MPEDPSKYSVAFASWWDEYSRRWRESGNDYAAVIAGAKAGWNARGRDISWILRVGSSEYRKFADKMIVWIWFTNSESASPKSPPSG